MNSSTGYDLKSKLKPSAVSVNNPSSEMRFKEPCVWHFDAISSAFALQVLGTQNFIMLFDCYVTFCGIIC